MKIKRFEMIILIGLLIITASCKKDKEDTSPEVSVKGEIIKHNVTLLGRDNPTDDSGMSFLNTSEGTTMNITEATAKQSDVDFVFYYRTGNSDYYTITSPASSVFKETPSPFEQIPDWSARNLTVFEKIKNVTPEMIDTASNDSVIIKYVKSPTSYSAANLKKNDVVAFKTAKGKKGIYIVDIVSGTNPEDYAISIHYIIQK